MSIIQYDVITDFPNSQVYLEKLHKQISLAGIVSAIFDGLVLRENTIDVIFIGTLSGGDQTTLDSVIAAHDGTSFVIGSNSISKTFFNSDTPDFGNDFSEGFEVGDIWINQDTKIAYVLIDSTLNNAIWKQVTPDLDGYTPGITFQNTKGEFLEIFHQILVALDGYTTSDSSGVSETTFQENKNAWNEIDHQILVSLDGYALRDIENQRWVDSSQQLQDLRDSSDGYGITIQEHAQYQDQFNQSVVQALDGYANLISGLDLTELQHTQQQNQINQTILQTLDGYAIRTIEDQRWIDSSQQLQDLRNSLDGYVVNNTFEENKNAQSEINNQILISLDGYASKITEAEHYTQLSQAVQDIVSVIDGYSTDIEFSGLTNTVTENNNQQQQINQSIRQALDGYASVPDTNAVGDGYVAFFIDGGRKIAGDNDLYFDRVNNQLQVSALKLTTAPIDGYVITSDISGNATWQENPGNPARHRELDQLVHNIAETSYETYTYSGGSISNITIWTSTEMVTKVREEQYTYSGSKINTVVVIQYNHLGVATETVTENYNYQGNTLLDITRTLT